MDVPFFDPCGPEKDQIRSKIAAGMASVRAGRVVDGEAFMADLTSDLGDADEAS
jgi:predicted transcriptional regulator